MPSLILDKRPLLINNFCGVRLKYPISGFGRQRRCRAMVRIDVISLVNMVSMGPVRGELENGKVEVDCGAIWTSSNENQ